MTATADCGVLLTVFPSFEPHRAQLTTCIQMNALLTVALFNDGDTESTIDWMRRLNSPVFLLSTPVRILPKVQSAT
jgi:hypothetical protein